MNKRTTEEQAFRAWLLYTNSRMAFEGVGSQLVRWYTTQRLNVFKRIEILREIARWTQIEFVKKVLMDRAANLALYAEQERRNKK